MDTTNCKRMARDLDEDLESEILVRLPAKSLMRFKCVQRSWNALFRNHRFVMSHMNMHMSKEHLMVFEDGKSIHASLTCDDPSQPPLYLNCSSPNKSFHFHWSLGSSCNGVFCLGVFDEHHVYRLILWNPNTREVNLIPSHSHTCERYSQFYCSGFDPNTNDFKFVILIRTHHNPPIISCAEVYNLSTNSWTFIHDLHHPIFSCRGSCYSHNVLVNGVWHWLTGDEGGFGYILCFDFCNFQFSKLMAPLDMSNLLVDDDIVEVNGSLGYIVQYYSQDLLEIWVMNEHKWTQTHNIVWPKEIFIFGVWKDGNQLLGVKERKKPTSWPTDDQEDNHPLTIYNLDAQPVHQFKVNGYPQVYKYTESIFPF